MVYGNKECCCCLKKISLIFQRGMDTLKITALSNHKPGILNNYIRMYIELDLSDCPLLLWFRVDRI